jgi:hypothetical protein
MTEANTTLFDTSGRIAGEVGGLAVWYEYEDLTKFDQGTIEAIANWWHYNVGAHGPQELRYVDLHPETLALIIRDGEKAAGMSIMPFGRLYNPNFAGGVCFWNDRQSGRLKEFPPLERHFDEQVDPVLSKVILRPKKTRKR